MQQPARSSDSGGDPATKGKNAGGSGTRGSERSDLPGKGEQGEGRSRISAGEVSFRSWTAASPTGDRTMLQVALTAREDIQATSNSSRWALAARRSQTMPCRFCRRTWSWAPRAIASAGRETCSRN